MKRLILLLLLISVGLNLGLGWRLRQIEDRLHPRSESTMKQPRHGAGRSGDILSGPQGMARFEDLGLTADQHDRLQAMREEHRTDMLSRRDRLMASRDELHEVLSTGGLDRDRITEIRRRHGREQANLDSLVTERLLQELEILTPEQRTRYLEKMPWRRLGSGGRR